MASAPAPYRGAWSLAEERRAERQEDPINKVLRRLRRVWDDSIRIMIAKDRMALADVDTSDLDELLEKKWGEIRALESLLKRMEWNPRKRKRS